MDVVELRNVSVAIALFAVTITFIAVGIYVVLRLRESAEEDRPPASELLTKFRDLHSRGELTDEEFRTIKTKLIEQLREELNDTDEKG